MRVLLVHGLGRTPLSLALLHRSLRRAGHAPLFFSYYAFAEPYDRIRLRLSKRLRELAHDPSPVALIGHSLGGLLLRDALSDAPELNVHRFIMMGTPNRPPRRALRAMHWLPFRLYTGSAGALLASPAAYARIGLPTVPYTVIAGTRAPRWLAPPFGDEPSDGIVAVSETRVRDSDEPLLLPVNHTFMMNDARLRELVVQLLVR